MDKYIQQILPEKFYKKWKEGKSDLVERHEELAILYGDLVGFTVLSRELAPGHTMQILNDLIDLLDEAAERHQIVRVSTVGHHYMAMSYAESSHENVKRLLQFGLEIREIVRRYAKDHSVALAQASAVCVGGAFEGVVGRKQMKYDVWGEAVNTAHFMSEYAESGELLISASVTERVGGDYLIEEKADVKELAGLKVWNVLSSVSE
ncbi:adenylate/guanylate cyclase domain-containing protein [Reichenbachiella ulvae]|uniref:Adenylate/guanylate cyclase domain-containing protein n=1 Tax=Reichenbachiella ulvae TaxID=2980104 RepID=A0ABT3CRQ6_9BACT|nr:adenylate/guanylate cyclase domain-containing protein [Reichenbachiella ulvae]MCV9386373.1 adenylate/guanylate cyclase domain-containing protein [Reichenbachiella ulvae]